MRKTSNVFADLPHNPFATGLFSAFLTSKSPFSSRRAPFPVIREQIFSFCSRQAPFSVIREQIFRFCSRRAPFPAIREQIFSFCSRSVRCRTSDFRLQSASARFHAGADPFRANAASSPHPASPVILTQNLYFCVPRAPFPFIREQIFRFCSRRAPFPVIREQIFIFCSRLDTFPSYEHIRELSVVR